MRMILISLIFSLPAQAAIYKCKDAQGMITYTEKPCEDAEEIHVPKAPELRAVPPLPYGSAEEEMGEEIINHAPPPPPPEPEKKPLDPYELYLKQKQEEEMNRKAAEYRKKRCHEFKQQYEKHWMDPLKGKQYMNKMRQYCD